MAFFWGGINPEHTQGLAWRGVDEHSPSSDPPSPACSTVFLAAPSQPLSLPPAVEPGAPRPGWASGRWLMSPGAVGTERGKAAQRAPPRRTANPYTAAPCARAPGEGCSPRPRTALCPCPALPCPAPPGCAAIAPEGVAQPTPGRFRAVAAPAVAVQGHARPAVPACAVRPVSGHAGVAARSVGVSAARPPPPARPPISKAMTAAPQGPDLSFLNEEEARAIFQVLQRDAELRRAEKDRVRYRLSPPSCRCPSRPRGGGGRGTGFAEGARPQPGGAGRRRSRSRFIPTGRAGKGAAGGRPAGKGLLRSRWRGAAVLRGRES